MSKFNRTTTRPAVKSPVVTEHSPSGVTHEGAPGYAREARGELFLLAVANMVGENAFYEKAGDRDERYERLVAQVAAEDPDWTLGFLRWLRLGGNMRSASLVGAAEAVRAQLSAGVTGGRQIIDAVLQRADEPGEILAYWTSRHGRAIPKPVKRGVADAVRRLYTERSLLKYDTASHGFRFADVLDLVHPSPDPAKPWQGALFAYALDRRHDRDLDTFGPLATIAANAQLRSDANVFPERMLDPEALSRAGMTWEDALSLVGSKVDKAKLWSALIPSMGIMACLAEGTPVWLADGTTAPIEDVVARRLPVLSFDKPWDTRQVKYGPNQPVREKSVGNLVPTIPTAWLNTGVRPVAEIRFVSGRVIAATYDHRWVRQRPSAGRQAWEWTTTADLRVGDRVPTPLAAGMFGDEGDAWDGYFVGAMLGDGGMTGCAAEFHGDPNDGAVAFMYDFATKHNCEVRERAGSGDKIVRLRFPCPSDLHRNPINELLRRYEVWGKRHEVKALPNAPFSREFWVGALSGLIDTDGCVRARRNTRGTVHGSVEFCTVSRRLAEQVSDALLRLGVTSIVREARLRRGGLGTRNFPLITVEVNRATAIVRLAALLDLRIGYKAKRLRELAEALAHVTPAASEMHGYDESVALDRVAAIEDAGEAPTYCVTVEPSNLFVANGLVTGNCARNLRNFDEAGVSDEVAAQVAARFADPEQVARSRMFPFRWLAAYRHAPSLRWGHALDKALTASLANVPTLPGRTLILVDVSGSMGTSAGGKLSDMTRMDVAAVFGSALAMRTDATLVAFDDTSTRVDVPAGGSLLRLVESIPRRGGGTYTVAALQRWYAGHDRVVIVTDEQAMGWGFGAPTVDQAHVSNSVPAHVPLYTWNLAGYKYGHAPSGSGNRHTFGGLSDQAFALIPLLESRRDGTWPWQSAG